VVIEKWESADHLKAHAAAPHMKAYGAKTKDMVAGRAIRKKRVGFARACMTPLLMPFR